MNTVPCPIDSYEERRRYIGDDLPDLSPAQAYAEASELLAYLQHLLDGDFPDFVAYYEPVLASSWVRRRIRQLMDAAPEGWSP